MSAGFGQHPVCMSGSVSKATGNQKAGGITHIFTSTTTGLLKLVPGAETVSENLDALAVSRAKASVCGFPSSNSSGRHLKVVVAIPADQLAADKVSLNTQS